MHYSTNNEDQLFAFVLYLFICWDWFFRFLHRGYLGMEKKTKIHLSSFDKLMQVGHFILCPLNFLAFFVQHYK